MEETTYLSDLVEPNASVVAIEDIQAGSFVVFTNATRNQVRAYKDAKGNLIAGVSNGIKTGDNIAQGEGLIVKKASVTVSNDEFMAILNGSSKIQS